MDDNETQTMTLVVFDNEARVRGNKDQLKGDFNLETLKFVAKHADDFRQMNVKFKILRFTKKTLTPKVKQTLKTKKIERLPALISPSGKIRWGVQGITQYLEDGIRNYRQSLHPPQPKPDEIKFTECQELSDFWRKAIELDNRDPISDEKKDEDLGNIAKRASAKPQPRHRDTLRDPDEDDEDERFQKVLANSKRRGATARQTPGGPGARRVPNNATAPGMRDKIKNAKMNNEDHELAARLGVSVNGVDNGVTRDGNRLEEPDDNIDIPRVSAETLNQLRTGMPEDDGDAREDAKMLEMLITRSAGTS